jgi:hypothetical protein
MYKSIFVLATVLFFSLTSKAADNCSAAGDGALQISDAGEVTVTKQGQSQYNYDKTKEKNKITFTTNGTTKTSFKEGYWSSDSLKSITLDANGRATQINYDHHLFDDLPHMGWGGITGSKTVSLGYKNGHCYVQKVSSKNDAGQVTLNASAEMCVELKEALKKQKSCDEAATASIRNIITKYGGSFEATTWIHSGPTQTVVQAGEYVSQCENTPGVAQSVADPIVWATAAEAKAMMKPAKAQ